MSNGTLERPPSYSGFGRPPELTYELINRIATHVWGGNHPLVAARAEGVAKRTWQRWIKQGEDDDEAEISSIYAVLWRVLDQKEADGECALTKEARERIVGWQGPMTILSRRHRERWEDSKQAAGPPLIIQVGAVNTAVDLGAFAPAIAAVERKQLETLRISGGSDKPSSVNQV